MKRILAVALAFLLVSPLFAQVVLAQGTHSVTVNWSASTSTGVTGYNVYRFVGACGPTATFVKLTTSPITALTYTDTTVTAGTTYCYTETSVSPGGESTGNGQLQMVVPIFTASAIPNPPGPSTGSAQ